MSQMASLVAYRHYLLLYVCWIICWKVKKYDDIRQIIQFKIFRIVNYLLFSNLLLVIYFWIFWILE